MVVVVKANQGGAKELGDSSRWSHWDYQMTLRMSSRTYRRGPMAIPMLRTRSLGLYFLLLASLVHADDQTARDCDGSQDNSRCRERTGGAWVCGPTFLILKQTSKISKLAKPDFGETAVCKPKSQTHCFDGVKPYVNGLRF